MTANEILRNKVEQIKTLEAKFGIDITILKILSNRKQDLPNGICVHYKINVLTDTFDSFNVNFVVFNSEEKIRTIARDNVMDLLKMIDYSTDKAYISKCVLDLHTDITDVRKILVYPEIRYSNHNVNINI